MTHKPAPFLGSRPAAAGAATDAESGNDGDSAGPALRALDAMRKRGLIPDEVYRERRAEILAGGKG